MKELLFGWLTKEYYKLSFLDSIIMILEMVLIVLSLFGIAYLVDYLNDKFKRSRKNGL